MTDTMRCLERGSMATVSLLSVGVVGDGAHNLTKVWLSGLPMAVIVATVMSIWALFLQKQGMLVAIEDLVEGEVQPAVWEGEKK